MFCALLLLIRASVRDSMDHMRAAFFLFVVVVGHEWISWKCETSGCFVCMFFFVHFLFLCACFFVSFLVLFAFVLVSLFEIGDQQIGRSAQSSRSDTCGARPFVHMRGTIAATDVTTAQSLQFRITIGVAMWAWLNA